GFVASRRGLHDVLHTQVQTLVGSAVERGGALGGERTTRAVSGGAPVHPVGGGVLQTGGLEIRTPRRIQTIGHGVREILHRLGVGGIQLRCRTGNFTQFTDSVQRVVLERIVSVPLLTGTGHLLVGKVTVRQGSRRRRLICVGPGLGRRQERRHSEET